MAAALFDVTEAAARLGLKVGQVRAEHARGMLPGRRVSRFLRFTDEDIATYLERIREDSASVTSGQTKRSARRSR